MRTMEGDVNEDGNVIREAQEEGKTKLQNKTGNTCNIVTTVQTNQCPQLNKDKKSQFVFTTGRLGEKL